MGLLFSGSMSPVETRQAFSTWSPADGYTGSTPEAALRLIPMYSATRLIADQIASAPLRAYRPRPDGARQALATQPQLIRKPGSTPFAWKFQAMTSVLLDGNAYGLIVSRDAIGTPTQIAWLNPARVEPHGRTDFLIDGDQIVPGSEILHVPGYLLAGERKGLSPVGMFRVTVETGRSAQQYARDWYDNGGIPAAVVRNETQTLTQGMADTIKARIKSTLRHGDPFVTGKDWTYEQVQAPAADMRFIETMRLTATQIAAIYGVPPEEIGGETGSSLTYGTLEQNQLKLAVQTIRPWAVRFEDAISDLFNGATYVKFGLDAGVRADLLTRYQAHEIALRIGLETNPEARSLEEKAPLTPDELAQWQDLYASNPPASLIATPTAPMAGVKP